MVGGIGMIFRAVVLVIFLTFFAKYSLNLGNYLWIGVVLFGLMIIMGFVALVSSRNKNTYSLFLSVLMLLSVLFLVLMGQKMSILLSFLAMLLYVLSLSSNDMDDDDEVESEVSSAMGTVEAETVAPSHSMVYDDQTAVSSVGGEETVVEEDDVVETEEAVDPQAQEILEEARVGSSPKSIVASKNGRNYHKAGSKKAERIKEPFKVYFDSRDEAEKAGFTPSSDFKDE